MTALDVVDGGDGSDTVSTANAATVSSVLGGISNVEKLALTASGATLTLTTDVGPSTFLIGDTDNQTVTLNDDYAQATTVQIIGDAGSADTITNNSGVDLTVAVYSTDLSGTASSAQVDDADVTASDTTLTLDAGHGVAVGTTLTIGTCLLYTSPSPRD